MRQWKPRSETREFSWSAQSDSDVKLSVNFITRNHLWDAGTEIPDAYVPDWARIKYRCSDAEAQEICRVRDELRREARERREAAEAKKAAKRIAGAKQSAGHE